MSARQNHKPIQWGKEWFSQHNSARKIGIYTQIMDLDLYYAPYTITQQQINNVNTGKTITSLEENMEKAS